MLAEVGDSPDRNAQLVQRLLSQLRTGGYTYTLDPGVYAGQAADQFWFDRKEGFCEHISAAFVIALRSAGVPARTQGAVDEQAPASGCQLADDLRD